MSDPSFSDTLDNAKHSHNKTTAYERDWWNKAGSAQRSSILRQISYSDIGTHYETASENAYQQDNKAKFNQIINNKYDSLPQIVKTIITESLIVAGELPDPSDFTGIGKAFEVEGSLDREVFIECDRCDEVFMDGEDFGSHKKVDHGDDDSNDKEAEESWIHSMSPESDRYALHESLKYIAETKEDELHRSDYFNGDALDFPTLSEPDGTGDDAGGNTIAGTQGYIDNPNEGLYDYTKFKQGSSADRNGGTVTEAEEPDEELETEFNKVADEADNYDQKDFGTPAEWDEQLHGLKDEYAGHGDDIVYENDGLSDISAVEPKEETNIDILDDVDISEEAIDFGHYPTKATEGKWAVEDFTEDEKEIQTTYTGQEDSEDEKVNDFVTERKISGYNDYGIARELEIRHGVSPEEALEKVQSIEVPVNDNIANTFFGKRFSQCNEAELAELQLYSGSVD